jgi:hypothetical protein
MGSGGTQAGDKNTILTGWCGSLKEMYWVRATDAAGIEGERDVGEDFG